MSLSIFEAAGKISLFTFAATVVLTGCQNSSITLPIDVKERAATCYAATITELGGSGTLTAEQANKSTQYLYLGAVNDGIAEASALPELAQRGEALRAGIEKAGNAKDYAGPCTEAFPSTKAGTFKSLPADDRNTRMMCYTLSTAAMQTYQSSSIAPPPEMTILNTKLDVGLRSEINATGNVNPAELAGFAMRSMAKAVEFGPMNEVLKACAARYNGG